MRREFHFPTALVIKEDRIVRVRFFARTCDQMQLVTGGQPKTANYFAGSDIILLADGGEGLPEFPEFPAGEQLFTGEALEIVFTGACSAEVDADGLHVTIEDGTVDCIRHRGLPFDNEQLDNAETFNLLGDVSLSDHPPHRPPPAP